MYIANHASNSWESYYKPILGLAISCALIILIVGSNLHAATQTQTFNAAGVSIDGPSPNTPGFATSNAVVNVGDFPVGSTVNDVTATVVFDKINGGTNGSEAFTCPNHVNGPVFNAEIFLSLQSPSAATSTLVNFSDYGMNTHPGFVTVNFDDAGGGGVSGVPTSGTFSPSSLLSVFDGSNPVGTWVFTAGDDFDRDPFCVQSFAMQIVADVPDPEVEFTVTTSSAAESAGTVNIQVTLEYAIDQDVTVPYTFNAASTATGGGTDYTDSTSGSVVITAGNTTANVQLAINNDILFEPSETVVIDLTAPATDAVLGTNTQHTLTITDNDSVADLSITKTDLSATYSPGGSATYTITVSNGGPASVNGVSVVDNLPAGVSNNGDWTCAPSGGASCISGSPPGTTIPNGTGNISQLVDIPFNGSVVFSLPVNFSANMGDY